MARSNPTHGEVYLMEPWHCSAGSSLLPITYLDECLCTKNIIYLHIIYYKQLIGLQSIDETEFIRSLSNWNFFNTPFWEEGTEMTTEAVVSIFPLGYDIIQLIFSNPIQSPTPESHSCYLKKLNSKILTTLRFLSAPCSEEIGKRAAWWPVYFSQAPWRS